MTTIDTWILYYLECDAGFYGSHCNNECHCLDNEICDQVIGQCPNKCDLGWKGISCNRCKKKFSLLQCQLLY